MHWHLSGFSNVIDISSQLVSNLLDRKPSPQEGPCLSVLRIDKVIIFESSSTSHTSCFLSQLSHVETDSALPLSLVEDNISLIHHNHILEYLMKSVSRNGVLVLLVDDVSFFIHDSEAFDLVKGTLEVHIVSELVFK
jgi:hypothetical protein